MVTSLIEHLFLLSQKLVCPLLLSHDSSLTTDTGRYEDASQEDRQSAHAIKPNRPGL